jgi:hypothetical protein
LWLEVTHFVFFFFALNSVLGLTHCKLYLLQSQSPIHYYFHRRITQTWVEKVLSVGFSG